MKHERLEAKDTKVIRLIVDNKYKWLRHVMLSLGLLVIISFSNRLSVFYSNRLSEYPSVYKYYRLACVYIGLMTMFYINMYILIPRFFFKGRYILYLVVLLILVMVCLALISNLLNTYFTPGRLVPHQYQTHNERSYYEGTIILAPIILVTTMIKLFQRWMRDNESMA